MNQLRSTVLIIAVFIHLFALACHSAPDGRITGRVTLDGPAPLDRWLSLDGRAAELQRTNRVLHKELKIDTMGGIAGVIVSLRSTNQVTAPLTNEATLTISPSGLHPSTLAVQTNQPIRIFNKDSVLRHVKIRDHAQQTGNRTIPVPPDNSVVVSFSEPAQLIDIRDAVITHQHAAVTVFNHPWLTVTADDGSFDFPRVAPGAYTIETYHSRLHDRSEEVTVRPARTSVVEFSSGPRYGLYAVRAGGPHVINGLSTRPESNKLRLFLWREQDGDVRCRLTNGEEADVLLWNVRIQVPSEGIGTDGLGWDTIVDDYPWPDVVDYNDDRLRDQKLTLARGRITPGQSGEFYVHDASPGPWRLCLIYQVESQPKRQCEAISNVMHPPATHGLESAESFYERLQSSMRRSEVEKILGKAIRTGGADRPSWYAHPSGTGEIGITWDQLGRIQSTELKRKRP